MDCQRTRFNNLGAAASKEYKRAGDGYEQFYSFDATNQKSYVAGFLGTDTITLEQLTVEQDFVPVFESHKVFKDFTDSSKFVPEGVLGLGVSSTVSTRAIKNLKSVSMPRPYTSFVRNLAEKGLIDKAFSLYFGSLPLRGIIKGEFVLGGFNENRITEAPHFIPVYRPGGPNEDIRWQVFGQAFKVYELESQSTLLNDQVDSTFAYPDIPTQADPRSSVIYEERFLRDKNELFKFATALPFSKLKQGYNNRLYRALTGSDPDKMDLENEPNSYIIDCQFGNDTTKMLSISFSHQQDSKTDPKPVHVEFPLSHLVIPYFDKDDKHTGCLWGPQDTEDDSEEMHLGLDILRQIYTTFDFNEYRIGLASAKDTPTKIIVE